MTSNTDLRDYQVMAYDYAIYPRDQLVMYPMLGLAGEVGELANTVKKIIRDDELDKEHIKREMGDVLWYLAALATDLEIDLREVAFENLRKLEGRYARGTLRGSGEDR